MFLIIEWNGIYEGITFALDSRNEPRKLDNREQSEKWAEKYCAFKYNVVEI